MGTRIIACLLIAFNLLRPPDIVPGQEYSVVPVLMYHQISEKSARLGTYVISAEEFEADLSKLRENGYTTVTVSDLLNYAEHDIALPDKPVMLTFDDGYQSDLVYALPLLEKYDMSAVFSIVGSYANTFSEPDVIKHVDYAYSSWDELKQMADSGRADIQSHGFDLHNLKKRKGGLKKSSESDEEYRAFIENDVNQINELFKQHLDTVPTSFACPFGNFNDTFQKTLQDNGISVIFTSQQKINRFSGEPAELLRINRFMRPHGFNLDKLIDQWEKETQKINRQASNVA